MIKKVLNSKFMMTLEYQNIKTFLKKAMFQIGLKKLLWLQNLNMLCRGHESFGTFYEKELKKNKKTKKNQTNQKELWVEKVIKRKGEKLYVKWKGYNSSFKS